LHNVDHVKIFVFLGMLRNKRRIKKESRFWDRYAASYDEAFDRDGQEICKHLAALIRKKLSLDDDVLDLACGTALFSIELLPYLRSLTGVDISTAMIREAEKKIPLQNASKVRFFVADSYSINFPDHTFDIVLFCNALHIIRHADMQFSEIRRVLKPGALLISCVPCYSEFTSWKARADYFLYFLKMLLGLIPHIKFLNRRKVLEMHKRNGFEVVKHQIIRESWYNGIYVEAVSKR
jgi:ubiquinone/menaquinone biosynthesis C-methylase UbiE